MNITTGLIVSASRERNTQPEHRQQIGCLHVPSLLMWSISIEALESCILDFSPILAKWLASVSSRISKIEIRNKHRHYERKEFFLCPPATDPPLLCKEGLGGGDCAFPPSFVRRGQGGGRTPPSSSSDLPIPRPSFSRSRRWHTGLCAIPDSSSPFPSARLF